MNAPERIEVTQDFEMTPLRDKSVLVTGGGSGLGAAICETLARSGAQVFVGEMNGDKAEQSARKLRDQGLSADAVVMDVGNESDVNGAVRRLVDRFGRIDAVINNAAHLRYEPIEQVTEATVDLMLGAGLKSAIWGSQALVRHMDP